MLLDAIDLGGGLRETRILGGGGEAGRRRATVSRPGSGHVPGAREQRQRTGVAEDDVVDPVVRLGCGGDQGLEVEVIESAVGDDDDARAGPDELIGRRNQHVVKLPARGVASLEWISGAEQGLAVVLYGGIDFAVGGKLKSATLDGVTAHRYDCSGLSQYSRMMAPVCREICSGVSVALNEVVLTPSPSAKVRARLCSTMRRASFVRPCSTRKSM